MDENITDQTVQTDAVDESTNGSEVDVHKLMETNKRLYGRVKAAEAELKTFKTVQTPTPQPQAQAPIMDDKLWEVAEYIREGYTRDDVDFIIKNGGRDALAKPDSFVSLALKAKQEQRSAEEAAAQTGNSGFGGIERQYSPDQLKSMSAKELADILPKADGYAGMNSFWTPKK